jgi:hypothetical protein
VTALRRSGALAATLAALVFCGIAAAPASAERIVATTGGTTPTLAVIESSTPGTPVLGPMPLIGLGSGQNLVGIDHRPSNGVLYAMTKDGSAVGRLYTIQIDSGGAFAQASLVGGLAFGLGASANYGVDWSPVVDVLRIVGTAGLNLRVNPENLVVPIQVDSNLDYDAADPNNAVTPQVTAIAYDNNRSGAISTTPHAFDLQEILSRLGSPGGSPTSPNSGLLFTIRTTTSTTNGEQGLDITPDNTAFMSATNAVNSFLIELNLTAPTGPLGTTLGAIGSDSNEYRHISSIPAGIFSVDDAVVREADGGILVTLHRRAGSVGTVAVNFATADGTATAGQDYTATNGTFTFDEGEVEETVVVTVAQDPQVEADETIQLQLSNPTNGAVLGDGSGLLTIADDDETLPSPATPKKKCKKGQKLKKGKCVKKKKKK